MKSSHVLGFPLTIVALTASVYPRAQTPPKQDVVSEARSAYYSLARKDFKGFNATIEPNWEVILAQTATPANLKVFRAIQFSLSVDANGAATVTHETGPSAPNADVVNKIHGDVQRLVTGFFNVWRIFVVGSPFRETPGDAKVENGEKQYRVSYRTQAGAMTITMTSDLLITEWNLAGPTLKRTMKPQFQKTVDGFLLTAYYATYEPVGEGIRTTLDFKIEYQDVSGMKVPRKVRLIGMYGSESVEAELVFTIKG